MDRTLAQTIGLGVLTAMLTVFVARVDAAPLKEAAGTIAADSVVHRDSTADIHWLSDANVLALVATMNGRQVAASTIEQASARSDSVRSFAAALGHEHADLQRSADSLAAALHITPVPPALNQIINDEFQAQIDSMLGNRGAELDRAYLTEQVASHKLMGDYLGQLSGGVQTPELRTWLDAANGKVATQITRLEGQQRAIAVADSIVADSLAKRAAARATDRRR